VPYISQGRREILADRELLPQTEGELNYIITRACQEYLSRVGVSYTNLNSIVGVLECAKLEFYRRMVVEYEEGKRRENGDVY